MRICNTFAEKRFFYRNLFVYLAVFFPAFFIVSQTAAQPGGCYAYTWEQEDCLKERNALLKNFKSQINEIDSKIRKDRDNAGNYYQRGVIYRKISGIFGRDTVKFDEKVYFQDLTDKALKDVSTAIKLDPRAEYFITRGDIYGGFWYGESKDFGYQMGNTDEEILKNIKRLSTENKNFKSAVSDYEKAIRLDTEEGEKGKIAKSRLNQLWYHRADRLVANERAGRIIDQTNLADIFLIDLDKYVEEIRILSRPTWLRSLLIFKGKIARRLRKFQIALEAFAEAKKLYADGWDSDVCRIYSEIAQIYFELQKLDLAIEQATAGINANEHFICRDLTSLRGDIYRYKGEKMQAIADYTIFINKNDSSFYTKEKVLWNRSQLYFQIKEYEKAIADITEVIRRTNLCEKHYQFRAMLYHQIGNEKAAREDEESAIRALEKQTKNIPRQYCNRFEYQP